MDTFFSEDEAMEMVLSVVSSPQKCQEYPPSTPARPRPQDRLLLLMPETPSPGDDALPTVSRYWTQVNSPRRTSSEPELRQARSSLLTTHAVDNQFIRALYRLPCIFCNEEKLGQESEKEVTVTSYGDHLDQSSETNTCQSLAEDDPTTLGDSSLTAETLRPKISRPEEKLPPVLYRWFNADSQGINSRFGITAGMFAPSDETSFAPAAVPEETFLEMFKDHVTKVPVPTPFISTFRSPLAPIHRGLRNGQGATVSVIDTSKLSTEVLKATPLVALTKTALPNWKGYGEYLVWNHVPTSAIAATFTISRLEEIASMYTDIGQFLQLSLIQQRRHCTRFLYSDLASGISPSRDGHTTTLQRLTFLLEVPDTVRDQVIKDLREAWTKKFRSLRFELPEDRIVHSPNLAYEFEWHRSNQVLTGQSQRDPSERDQSLSGSSYRPSLTDSDSSSGTIDSPSRAPTEEPEVKCPRHDTSSEGYSCDDDSSDEDWHRPIEDDEDDLEMVDGQEGDGDWPSDEETACDQSIAWLTISLRS